MTGEPWWQDLLKILPAFAAIIAALIRVIPLLITSSKSQSRTRNLSHRTLRVTSVAATPPWDKSTWPENWATEVAVREQYRKSERQGISVVFVISFVLAVIYGLTVADDMWWDFFPWHAGSGAAAGPAFLVFLVVCVVQARFWLRTRADRALGPTLYGERASVWTIGNLPDARQYCLGALYELGSKIVSCAESRPDAGPAKVSIVAATGFFPRWRRLLDWGPFKLISFRGQKIEVLIEQLTDSYLVIHISSDNLDPGVDEGYRANKRNVRLFVDSWAFFPESADRVG